jgi:PAS domain S-box-containing protein
LNLPAKLTPSATAKRYTRSVNPEHEAFRAIVESADEGIAILASGTGDSVQLTYQNAALERMLTKVGDTADLGSIADRLLSTNIPEFVIRSIESRGYHHFSLRFAAREEGAPNLSARVIPLGDRHVALLLQYANTSRGSHGFAVEDVWRAMAENPVDYFSVLDRAGRYLYVNRTTTGFKLEDVLDKATIYDFTVPEDHDKIRLALDEAFQSGKTTSWESYVPVVEQWYLMILGPVVRDGQTYCVSVTAREITSQKQAEIALRHSEARFRALAEHAPDHILLVDRDLKITYINHLVDELHEIAIHGTLALDHLVECDRQRVEAIVRKVLETGESARYQAELNLPTGPRSFSCHASAMVQDNAIVGLIILASDNTEQLKIQAMIQQNAKMASIGELAAGVGHEINNPLMALLGNVEILEDLIAEKADIRETQPIVATIRDMSDRITKIVGGLRKFARIGSGDEYFSVHHAILESMDLLERLFGFKEVRFSANLAATNDACRGDSSQFQQVIINLLSNAKDALARRNDGVISLTTENEGPNIVIEVSDNGVGISSEAMPRIFNAFFTTKERGEGTGIGLSISKSIVESMQGSIGATSSLGQGSTFRIEIPTSTEAQVSSAPVTNRVNRVSGSVLLVDDDHAVLQTVSRLLTSLGLNVQAVHDPQVALELLKSNRYEFLISDHKMPNLSGEELIASAPRASIAATSCFIMTGWANLDANGDRWLTIADRKVGVIRKPVSRAMLAAILGRT